jgi:hypothetical protein
MSNHYKYLIIVECITDIITYSELLPRYGVSTEDFFLFSAHGKGNVCNADTWDKLYSSEQKNTLLDTIINDLGRINFGLIILLIDSDRLINNPFSNYKRSKDMRLNYVYSKKPKQLDKKTYYYLDALKGTHNIPILGINVPWSSSGCLESDLLSTYGFPVEGQDEYSQFVEIIKKASGKWQISKQSKKGEWWTENRKAKFDKFIYCALSCGFKVSRKEPQLPHEPEVISKIKSALSCLKANSQACFLK